MSSDDETGADDTVAASELPQDEVANFNALPSVGQFQRAHADATKFLHLVLGRQLRLDRVQIGQTTETFTFEWNRTYVEIPIDLPLDGTRYYVHYVHDDRARSEFNKFKSADAAMPSVCSYVTSGDEL